MLNKIFITIILLCGISFAYELENCVYTVSQFDIIFHCDLNGGNSNYEMSFRKSDITFCTETVYTERSETTLAFNRFYYNKVVKDELGATIVDSQHYIDCKDICRESYDQLKSISTRYKSNAVSSQQLIVKDMQLTRI
jgi:hypothetical protein